jgi:hypothetical protein
MFSMGCIVGSPPSGFLTDFVGRKRYISILRLQPSAPSSSSSAPPTGPAVSSPASVGSGGGPGEEGGGQEGVVSSPCSLIASLER